MKGRYYYDILKYTCIGFAALGIAAELHLYSDYRKSPLQYTAKKQKPASIYLYNEGFFDAKEVLKQQSELFDLFPVFLPSRYNYSENLSSILNPSASNLNEFIDPVLSLLEFKIAYTYIQKGFSETPLQALSWNYWSFFKTFLSQKEKNVWIESVLGSLECKNLLNDKVAILSLGGDINLNFMPAVESIEYLFFKDNTFYMSPAVPLNGSGSYEMDELVLNQLMDNTKSFILNPGYYKVEYRWPLVSSLKSAY